MKSVQEILKEKYKNSIQDIILVDADVVSKYGYTLVPNYIFRNDKISGRAKLVYAALLSYAWGDKNSSFPGQDRLAEDCGCSPRSIWSAIDELEKEGFILIIRRGLGKTNKYLLLLKKTDQQEKLEETD